MPPLDWGSLQAHDGSKTSAFELLVKSLARRDKRFAGTHALFHTLGVPDGGVECYWETLDGAVHGYQAKYFTDSFGETQVKQISKSFESALATYPGLKSYVVAIPHELPNSAGREAGKKSAHQRWLEWVAKVRTDHPNVEIMLWNKSTLSDKLADESCVGLRAFYFGQHTLSIEKLRAQFDVQKTRCGVRYSPHLHVQHTLEGHFSLLANGNEQRAVDRAVVHRLMGVVSSLKQNVDVAANTEVIASLNDVELALNRFEACRQKQPPVGLRDAATRLIAAAAPVYGRLESVVMSLSKLRKGDARQQTTDKERDINRQSRALSEQIYELVGTTWLAERATLIERGLLAISGSGGVGKTHLACHAVDDALRAGCPALVVFGHEIDHADVWRSISRELGTFASPDEFLATLDAAGEASRCRAVIVIDALNEGKSTERWRDELPAIATRLRGYPNVALAATMRTELLNRIFPDHGHEKFTIAYHTGFDDEPDELSDRYFAHYGIHPDAKLPSVGNLGNPLFLRIFCEAIAGDPAEREGKPLLTELPSNVGLAQIFDQFLDRREDDLARVCGSIDRDRTDKPLRFAIRELAKELAKRGRRSIPIEDAQSLIEKHLRAAPPFYPIGYLESSGVLLRWWSSGNFGSDATEIGFAFDRLGAHLVVQSALDGFHSAELAVQQLQSDAPIGKLLASEPSYAASIFGALVLEWSSRFEKDLFESAPSTVGLSDFAGEYLRAIPLLKIETAFTAKGVKTCLDLIAERMLKSPHGFVLPDLHDALWELLWRRSGPVANEAASKWLSSLPLADRDFLWTIPLSEGGVHIKDLLIRFIAGIADLASDAQALNYARACAWIATTTDRALRAVAVKAISALGTRHVGIGPTLLSEFRSVDDPWVLHAVATGLYGAAMKTADRQALTRLAQAVVDSFPQKQQWPLDLVTRHSLSNIVRLAGVRAGFAVPGVLISPPFESDWIEEPPAWDELKQRAGKMDGTAWRAARTIVSSCQSLHEAQWGYGDFGRYVVDGSVKKFLRSGKLYSDPPEGPFSPTLPHRFIVTRVWQLGWTPQRFGLFDEASGSPDRRTANRERIGKKYQWIALSEFMARACDHFPIVTERQRGDTTESFVSIDQVYSPTWIDPSLVLAGVIQSEEAVPWDAELRGSMTRERDTAKWAIDRRSAPSIERVVFDDASAIAPGTVAICASMSLSECDPTSGAASDDFRKVGLQVVSFAIKAKDLEVLRRAFEVSEPDHSFGVDRPNNDCLSRYFGECFWQTNHSVEPEQLARGDGSDWDREHVSFASSNIDVLHFTTQHFNEKDPGNVSGMTLGLPSKWLISELGLRVGTNDLEWIDGDGKRVVWELAGGTHSHDVLVCDFERLKKATADRGWAICWCARGWLTTPYHAAQANEVPGSSYFQELIWEVEGKRDKRTRFTSDPSWKPMG